MHLPITDLLKKAKRLSSPLEEAIPY